MTGSKPKIRLVVDLATRPAGNRAWLLLKLRHANGPYSRVAFPAVLVGRFARQLEAVRDELLAQRASAASAAGNGSGGDEQDDGPTDPPTILRSDWHGAFFGAPFVRAYDSIAIMIVGDTDSSAEEGFMLPLPMVQKLLRELQRRQADLIGAEPG